MKKLPYIGLGIGVVTAAWALRGFNTWLRWGSDEDWKLPLTWGRRGWIP